MESRFHTLTLQEMWSLEELNEFGAGAELQTGKAQDEILCSLSLHLKSIYGCEFADRGIHLYICRSHESAE